MWTLKPPRIRTGVHSVERRARRRAMWESIDDWGRLVSKRVLPQKLLSQKIGRAHV